MEVNVGLSKTTPYLAWGGKIRPTEIDMLHQYTYLQPDASDSAIMNTLSGTGLAGTITKGELDYPRNIMVSFTDASGTTWNCSVVVAGKDQFGNTISETFALAGDGTLSTNGTKIFDKVTSVVNTPSAGSAAGDDIRIGYVVAAGTAKLGLYTKVGAVADVKRVQWNDNGTLKPGTATVDTTYHAITLAGAISGDDDYLVYVKPNYTTDDNDIANLGTSSLIS
jgi:hypothetical protein